MGIVSAALFITILVLAAFYWHSNHQTTDIDDMKSNNTTDVRLGDTNKTNDTKSKTIKSIELEKPPFID